MKRQSPLVVPAIIVGIMALGSLIIVLSLGGGPRAKRHRVVAVLKTIDRDMEFWVTVQAGMQEAAKEQGVDLELSGPMVESDVDTQIRLLDEAVGTRPDSIILAAGDHERLIPGVERAAAAGIPVITLDSGVNSGIPRCFVATNNVEAGIKAGKAMIAGLTPGARVAIVSHVRGATTAIEREAGVKRAFDEDGRFTIIGTYFTDNFVDNAYAIAKRLTAEESDLAGIIALNEISTVGVARALQEAGLGGKKRLVGFDNSLYEIKLIEEGVIAATVVQQPFNMGYLAVTQADKAARGERLDPYIDTGSVLITAGNMYTPENQKILFPFADN